jgi:hypothetical protein
MPKTKKMNVKKMNVKKYNIKKTRTSLKNKINHYILKKQDICCEKDITPLDI